MATQGQIRDALNRGARDVLGKPLPASVSVTVRGNRVDIVGPPGSGKTIAAKAALRQLGGGLRIFTGTHADALEEESAR